ncbi:hypothetical protein [Streptococcus pneumoniae]
MTRQFLSATSKQCFEQPEPQSSTLSNLRLAS